MFNNIEEASEFWRTLWETEGTGDRNAAWLEQIRSAIHSRVPESAEEDWDLDETDAAKVLTKIDEELERAGPRSSGELLVETRSLSS